METQSKNNKLYLKKLNSKSPSANHYNLLHINTQVPLVYLTPPKKGHMKVYKSVTLHFQIKTYHIYGTLYDGK